MQANDDSLERLIRPGVMIFVFLLAAALSIYKLNQVGINGLGSPYYAAAVKSMLMNRRNFFYLAVDPAGFVSLDKPPLPFWFQAGIATLFGFHGMALLLPQVLAGLLSIFILNRLVCYTHGRWAGIAAALALTATPISVVTNRTNFPDPFLILSLLLAAAAVLRAVETDSFAWTLVSAALLGLGFNAKMLQIGLAAPAMGLVYMARARIPWRLRLQRGLWAGVVFCLVAFAWGSVVSMTPAEARPYLGGSRTNQMVDLVVGYNGIDRLWGENWAGFLGEPGPLRLLNQQHAGQISWLLPVGVFGVIIAFQHRPRIDGRNTDHFRKIDALLLWSVWLLVSWIYFSISSFYHRYYLATMAPALAALVGIGIRELWLLSVENNFKSRLWGVLVVIGTGIFQTIIISSYDGWQWLIAVVLVVPQAGAGIYLLGEYFQVELFKSRRIKGGAFVVGILGLFIAPVVWSGIPVVTCVDRTLALPVGGPQPQTCRPFELGPFLDPALVDYLQENREGAEFLAATYDMGIASLGILETGETILALGGYRGSDPILTDSAFADMVAAGKVRFALSLIQETESFPVQDPIKNWITAHCPEAPYQSEGVLVLGPCE